MSRKRKQSMLMLPHLSASSGNTRSLTLEEETASTRNVFTPSALHTHKRPISTTTNRFFSVVLFGLFIIMLLIALLVGINVYQSLDTMAQAERLDRLDQAFLANIIHDNDIADAVEVSEGPEGKALILRETLDDASSYETRIYAHDGKVVEDYVLAGSPFIPEKAITLFNSDTLDFSYEQGLITIVTDDGQVSVALRSKGGEA